MSPVPVVAPVVAPWPARGTKPWDTPLRAYIDSLVASQAFDGGQALADHVGASTNVHGVDDMGSIVHRQTGNKINSGRGANYYDEDGGLVAVLEVDHTYDHDNDSPNPVLVLQRRNRSVDFPTEGYGGDTGPLLVLRADTSDDYGDFYGDLLRIEAADKSLLFRVSANDGVLAPYAFVDQLSSQNFYGQNVGVYASLTINPGVSVGNGGYQGSPILVVKGNPAQSAPLLQAENSSGGFLSAITASGAFRVGSTAEMGKHASLDAPQFNSQVFAAGAFRSDAGFNPNTGGNGFALTNEGLGLLANGARLRVSSNATMPAFEFHVGNALSTTQLGLFNATFPAIVPVTAKGAAAQTADLFQARSSSEAVLAKIANNGDFTTQGFVSATVGYFTSSGSSVNLQGTTFQMARSAGYYFDNIHGNGPILFRSTVTTAADTEMLRMTTQGVVINNSGNFATSTVPLAIRGSAGQANSILSIKSSANVEMSAFQPDGSLNFYRIAAATAGATTQNSPSIKLLSSGWSGTAADERFGIIGNNRQGGGGAQARMWFGDQTNPDASTLAIALDGTRTATIGTGFSESSTAQLVVASTADRVTQINRAFAGQTADYHRWVNSSGSALAYVSSTGRVHGSSIRTSGEFVTTSTDFTMSLDASGPVVKANATAIEHMRAGSSVVIRSNNGTRYRIGVTDAGALTTAAA